MNTTRSTATPKFSMFLSAILSPVADFDLKSVDKQTEQQTIDKQVGAIGALTQQVIAQADMINTSPGKKTELKRAFLGFTDRMLGLFKQKITDLENGGDPNSPAHGTLFQVLTDSRSKIDELHVSFGGKTTLGRAAAKPAQPERRVGADD